MNTILKHRKVGIPEKQLHAPWSKSDTTRRRGELHCVTVFQLWMINTTGLRRLQSVFRKSGRARDGPKRPAQWTSTIEHCSTGLLYTRAAQSCSIQHWAVILYLNI